MMLRVLALLLITVEAVTIQIPKMPRGVWVLDLRRVEISIIVVARFGFDRMVDSLACVLLYRIKIYSRFCKKDEEL